MTKAKLYIQEIAGVRRLNKSQLQIKAGVTTSMLDRYWHNRTESVDLEKISMIAQALNVPVASLFTGEMPAEEEQAHV